MRATVARLVKQPENLPEVDPSNRFEEIDTAVADALVPLRDNRAVHALGTASDLSDQEPIYAAAAATLVTAALLRDGRTWRAGTRILAVHLLATALRGVVKAMVDRTRPEAAVRRGEYVLQKGRHRDSDFNSFPSGHTAGAVAVARAIGRDYPGARGPGMALAAVAGGAQVVRSRHFVSDVVAGAVIGWVAEALIDAMIRVARKV